MPAWGRRLSAWEAELGVALGMAVDHLSLYQLTIEAGTRFAELYEAGRLSVPQDGIAAEMYDLTQEMTAAAGLPAYEVSNHARKGAESRHNLIYWRYGDYAGAGPGAHGRITERDGSRRAIATRRAPQHWLDAVAEQGHGIEAEEPVPGSAQAEEFLMMGLRLSEGVDPDRFKALAGRAVPETKIAALAESGHIAVHGRRIVATAKGRIVLNAVLSELLS